TRPAPQTELRDGIEGLLNSGGAAFRSIDASNHRPTITGHRYSSIVVETGLLIAISEDGGGGSNLFGPRARILALVCLSVRGRQRYERAGKGVWQRTPARIADHRARLRAAAKHARQRIRQS